MRCHLKVFDELTPVPEVPVTTLSAIPPELAILVQLEIQRQMDKEREQIRADAIKQAMRQMRQMQQRMQPSCNIVSGSQQEGVASSAPQDNNAGSEMSVNTVAPVPQDDGAASEASVNTVVTDNGWIHFEQTDENAPTGLSEEADASG